MYFFFLTLRILINLFFTFARRSQESSECNPSNSKRKRKKKRKARAEGKRERAGRIRARFALGRVAARYLHASSSRRPPPALLRIRIPKVRSLLPRFFPFASFSPVLALQAPLPPYDFPLRSPLAEVAPLIAERGINLRYFPRVQLACKVEIFVRLPALEFFVCL